MIQDDDLDALLSSPLDVADEGFSARVAARLRVRETWRERVTLFAPVAAVAALVPFLPGEELTNAALRITPLLANSAAISLAAAALILTISFEQRFREWQSSAL